MKRFRSVRPSVWLVWSLCCVCFATETLAWGPAGHKIIASIAFLRLSPGKQEAVIALLKHHPRFKEDFEKRTPEELRERDDNEWIIQQAAIWPDIARNLKGNGRNRVYNHPKWHFIDLPIFLTEEDENALKDRIRNRFNLSLREPHRSKSPGSMNIMQAIAHSKAIAFDPDADAEERALYLSWLIHLRT